METNQRFDTASPISADDYTGKKDFLSGFWRSVFIEANDLNASDIHVKQEPRRVYIEFRIDGSLQEVREYTQDKSTRLSLTNRLKQIANADLSVQNEPQSCSFYLTLTNSRYRLEISPVAQIGEYFVLRIIRENDIPSLENCNLRPNAFNDLRKALSQKKGLICITGPTGSGKSTTLQACLMSMDRVRNNILSIENPTERNLERVTQMEITPTFTWKKAIKSAMRLDPDIVMIGEIRDEESASLALEFSQTGHLVLTTLHTNDTASTIDRLIGLNVDRHLIADNLLLVAAQRLIKKLCPDCKEATEDGRFTCGNGCKTCCLNANSAIGISGRIPIFEYSFMPPSESIFNFNKKDFSKNHLKSSLRDECLYLIEQGLVDCKELEFYGESQ